MAFLNLIKLLGEIMKKRLLAILLIFVVSFAFIGCSKVENNDSGVVNAYDGVCQIYMTKKNSFYIPVVVGWIALNSIPNKIEVDCANQTFELDIKSVNVSSTGLYLLHFKQTEIFGNLTAGTHSVNLFITFGDTVIRIQNFDEFDCDDNYFIVNGINLESGEPIYLMDKESNWIGPY